MLTVSFSLVVYIAAAFFPGDETRYAVFANKEACEAAVAQVRATGQFVTDCIAVELPKPSNGQKS